MNICLAIMFGCLAVMVGALILGAMVGGSTPLTLWQVLAVILPGVVVGFGSWVLMECSDV